MTEEEIKSFIITKLRTIAPEINFDLIKPTDNLREELDIDSIDWLDFLVSVEEKLKVTIPESDYQLLDTMEHMVGYLLQKTSI